MKGISARSDRARLFLRGKPFLSGGSAIKHLAAYARAWRSHAKRIPTIERALVPLQFGGKFFLRQKI
jgi:hypothetical protein